jgi:hypothetical protein
MRTASACSARRVAVPFERSGPHDGPDVPVADVYTRQSGRIRFGSGSSGRLRGAGYESLLQRARTYIYSDRVANHGDCGRGTRAALKSLEKSRVARGTRSAPARAGPRGGYSRGVASLGHPPRSPPARRSSLWLVGDRSPRPLASQRRAARVGCWGARDPPARRRDTGRNLQQPCAALFSAAHIERGRRAACSTGLPGLQRRGPVSHRNGA